MNKRNLRIFGAPSSNIGEAELESLGIVLQIGVAPRRIDILTSIDAVDSDDAGRDRLEAEIEGLKVPMISRRQDLADVARLERGEG